MTRIKICGISQVDDAIVTAGAGADFIGLVFAESRRQVATAKARRISEAVREVKPGIEMVGVFVNSTTDDVNRAADYCNLDRVQLSGDEDWDYCGAIERPIIKVFHVSPYRSTEEILNNMAAGSLLIAKDRLICLLDSKEGKPYGGTGQRFDWNVARDAAVRFPVLVAGGLTPGNVTALIRAAHPWGVDVSSGVETDGRKDTARIQAFVEAVKAADREFAEGAGVRPGGRR